METEIIEKEWKLSPMGAIEDKIIEKQEKVSPTRAIGDRNHRKARKIVSNVGNWRQKPK